jgi:hypothetical protein
MVPPSSVDVVLPNGIDYVDGYPVADVAWLRCWWGRSHSVTVELDLTTLRMIVRPGNNGHHRRVRLDLRAEVLEERRIAPERDSR